MMPGAQHGILEMPPFWLSVLCPPSCHLSSLSLKPWSMSPGHLLAALLPFVFLFYTSGAQSPTDSCVLYLSPTAPLVDQTLRSPSPRTYITLSLIGTAGASSRPLFVAAPIHELFCGCTLGMLAFSWLDYRYRTIFPLTWGPSLSTCPLPSW